MHVIDWRKGWQSGLKSAWELAKVIFPITLLVQIIQYTPIMDWLTQGLAPFMSWIGLSGEAAIPLVLGHVLNLYAAIGAILTLDLTVKQVFIIAMMLSFSHNIFVESAICKRVGVSTWIVVSVRLGLALLSAFLIHLCWHGGSQLAAFGVIKPQSAKPEGWTEILLSALAIAAKGVFTLVLIVLPLMMMIQILKDLRVLDWFAGKLTPLLRPFGIAPEGAITLTSGLFAGLMFGAGLIIQQAEEKNFSKRDITLIFIFLAACHAVIEDTLVFVPLGIPVLYLLIIRILVAILLTFFIAQFWSERSVHRVTTTQK
ncbi:nucleoside recognition domain-containing protein [Paenactinomyces guangxiensis]|uniref:Nucleoside recognition domain-containing protein n=1 Tax=Paenactinomyces guangxiensis TaxID=1490290 RepID=A0A7W1WN47_9BACL|nr:nucleoside recognition domain-containing protein [Paenactinomyces guangxiensis]MBA4492764.1 nucleoside recognition domain-containing protein [Paenactinomyces guangxiensis]MBH8590387.1 nucleoside recognition domain-containing protein [Paenactinomyces guangxiensis]